MTNETTDQAIERRTNSELLLTFVKEILDNQHKLNTKLTNHMLEESQEIADKIAESLSKLANEAFVDSDLAAHKSDHENRFNGIEAQLVLGEARMGKIEESIDANTKVTSEIYEIISAGKGFFKVTEEIGNAVKWVVGIVSVCAALWFTIKNGGK
jgi:hypothetical protein